MQKIITQVIRKFFPTGLRAGLVAGLLGLTGVPFASAQQLSTQQGHALRVDLAHEARSLSMRNAYNRALYLYIRSNPSVLQNQMFFANFLIFLMQQSDGFECDRAFANEFERRDYFGSAMALAPQMFDIVNGVTISERFDIAYIVDTGRYDFTTANLPFADITRVDLRGSLSERVSAINDQSYCARNILSGTQVDTDQFPWSFDVVNETNKNASPGFPFGGSMKMSDGDARVLFERFGRQLYAVVSYSFKSANDGRRLIQIVPTDGQLFGLSSDAVVRVQTYAHPRLSQPNYLDLSHPMSIRIPSLNNAMSAQFEQDGFRAVGTGSQQGAGTEITAGQTFAISGSAAVGNSTYIMRFAIDGSTINSELFNQAVPGAQYFVTLFGSIDFEKITETQAPTSGTARFLQQAPNAGALISARKSYAFEGVFTPASMTETTEPEVPATQLDQSTISNVSDQ